MDEVKLRKYEHMLVISGFGVIAFGVWSVVKAAIYFIVMPSEQMALLLTAQDLTGLEETGFTAEDAGYIMAAGIMIGLLLDLLLRFYIGRSAVKDGRRIRRKTPVYIVLAGMLSVGLVFSTINSLFIGELSDAEQDVLSTGNVSVLINLTSMLALIQMIVAAIMVRRIRKQLPAGRKEVA